MIYAFVGIAPDQEGSSWLPNGKATARALPDIARLVKEWRRRAREHAVKRTETFTGHHHQGDEEKAAHAEEDGLSEGLLSAAQELANALGLQVEDGPPGRRRD